jgi:hypothetical protein
MVIGSPVALPSCSELAARWLVDSSANTTNWPRGVLRFFRGNWEIGKFVKVSPLREWPVLFAEQSILI